LWNHAAVSAREQIPHPSPPLSRAGSLYALLAYTTWGFAPIFWKQLDQIEATELLAYRSLGSLSLATLLIVSLGQWSQLRSSLQSRRQQWLLLGSSLLLGCNWWIFIWAVNNDRIVDTSLGYYLTPLLNVALGMAIFRERLSRPQALAVALAAAGVAYMAWDLGRLPWISLALGFTFAAYGLLRKWCEVSSLGGLVVEAGLLAGPALGYLAQREISGQGALSRLGELPAGTLGLLAGTGLVTAFPLVCFASAARRLPLSALGLFQYLAPSLSLGVAVWLYAEPFTRAHAITFGLIWCALALFSWAGFGPMRQREQLAAGLDSPASRVE